MCVDAANDDDADAIYVCTVGFPSQGVGDQACLTETALMAFLEPAKVLSLRPAQLSILVRNVARTPHSRSKPRISLSNNS
jgi:hypothetical protein